MMNIIKLFSLAICSLFFTACVFGDDLSSCEFVYNDSVKKNVIKPKMEEYAGKSIRFYDLDKPFLYPVGKQTKAVFSPLLLDGWRQETQEVSYVFHFDSCTSKLLDFYRREYN